MDFLLLQLWGGACYLLNKAFFSLTERTADGRAKRKWRLWAWAVYLAGVPPWVFIFISERNWIAAAVESSGVPAMLMGLTLAWQGHDGEKNGRAWLDLLAKLMVVTGLGLSLYDFGGITSPKQLLELCIAAGFLLGTYLLAKERPNGYFWLMVGNVSAASLMGLQGYYLLMTQQILSLGFVIDAYLIQRKRTTNL